MHVSERATRVYYAVRSFLFSKEGIIAPAGNFTKLTLETEVMDG